MSPWACHRGPHCGAAQVGLLGLLPRGWTEQQRMYNWPSKYASGVAAVNARFERLADAHRHVHYIDCGAAFVIDRAGRQQIDEQLMPDATHPSALGMDALGLCLDPTIAFLVQVHRPVGARHGLHSSLPRAG
jgi:lysophospholipase L1-like esterase